MAFQFKQFSIEDRDSAMKVGTDAVLLGSWIQSGQSESILDIGTGSGVIALILAQKTRACIDAIDIDETTIEQAGKNFINSPWSSRLKAIHCSLQEYCKISSRKYDLIVSNPPFFDQSLKSPNAQKNISKHTELLRFEELAHGITQLLNPKGKAFLILPPTEAIRFLNCALIEGLYCNKKLIIKPVEDKSHNRWIMELSLIRTATEESCISIRNKNHGYTPEYMALTRDLYLNF